MRLLDVNTHRETYYHLLDTTRITDQAGNAITLYALNLGRVVDIVYEVGTNNLVRVSENTQAWERRQRTNARINMENSTITIGNDIFYFNSRTLVLNNGEIFSPGEISPIDTITVSGFRDTAWLIQVDSSHGFLRLEGASHITGGRFVISNILQMDLADANRDITLNEGSYRIVLNGSNIDTFTYDFTIRTGEITIVNLAGAELRQAILHFSVNPPGANIFINGELHVGSSPAFVGFGEHTVRAEMQGYQTQTQTINMTSAVATLPQFNLVREGAPPGPAPGQRETFLLVTTEPQGARIYIDDEFIDYSPVARPRYTGPTTITARMDGRETAVIETTLVDIQNLYHITLEPAEF